MYLKSIEVQGFKSFANKINFEFHNGITGIVGPNGSGKSNVADAVRWVLGEQRIKQLRGAKMEDVIFAGTELRKPLGFAYVAITLNNADHQLNIDFEEVTVSRRLFRSGESEYMINGAECRLKDINELFYDTGIGKEGYSIIGQGQIDRILSGRPEDRRELFDEAAGIVKFKRRKVETLRKLEDEKANLDRVNDIISELERQIKPLERQSETARKYLKYKDDLKSLDINVFLLEMTQINDNLKEIDRKSDIANNEIIEKKQELDETKSQYEQLDEFIENLNKAIDEKREVLNKTIVMKEKLEGDVRLLNEQINSAKQNDEHINSRITAIMESISTNEQEKERYIKEKEEINGKISGSADIRQEAEGKVGLITARINELKEQIEEAKTQIIENMSEKSNVNSRISRYDTMLEQINARKDSIRQNIHKYKEDSEEQNKLITQYEAEMKEVNDKIISLSETNEVNELRISELAKEKKDLYQKQDNLNEKFHKINSNIDLLNNMTERYEGYGNSIKKIMELKETKKGIIGVVADIISSDKKYEIAIETALGASIQNVVTDNENTAKDAIEYLKRGKFGRATFLPLNSIANKTGFTNERALTENGVIGLACDLVNTKKEYENIAKYLLGRTLVIDTVDNALIIARKYSYTLRMVTLEGEQLNPGGSLSGGAFKNSSNLLGRRRELEELKKSLDETKELLGSIAKKIEENDKESKALKEKYEKDKIVLNENFLLQNTIKMQLNTADTKRKELSDNYNNVNSENSEIDKQLAEIEENCNNMKAELAKCDEKNAELESKVKELNTLLDEESAKESEELKNNEELRLSLSTLNQQSDFVRENINRINSEIIKLKEEMEDIKNSAEDSSKDIEIKNQEINAILESVSKADETINSINAQLDDIGKDKENQTKDHKEFFTKREELTDHINELDKEILRLTNQKEKYDEQKEKQVNYMWDEYEITYGNAQTMRNEEYTNLPQMKKLIANLKTDIRDLGDVNVNAIDEYKEVSERYTFLKTQHDDLIVAEDTLIKIIEELDEGMKKQFTEKFEEIKVEFDKVFKELFGGGSGNIEIVEDEDTDILEAGISIISQPPGKKLQNMMQLSGGEKALTAIALLFAIQNLKPSPFCLLDEIEAALDDSNVTRFAKYLHKLTDHTQFIVITHRRGTMACADRLYGITMQEKGVSTLVSVNLIEEELEAMEQKSNN